MVFFNGVVDGFLAVENTMNFFSVWVSRSSGGQSLWGCGGCLRLYKFGVGLKGSDALIPSQCRTYRK